MTVNSSGVVSMSTRLLPDAGPYQFSYEYGLDSTTKMPHLTASISYQFDQYIMKTKYGELTLTGTTALENIFRPNVHGVCAYAIALQRYGETALPYIQLGLASAGLIIAMPEAIPSVLSTGTISTVTTGPVYANYHSSLHKKLVIVTIHYTLNI